MRYGSSGQSGKRFSLWFSIFFPLECWFSLVCLRFYLNFFFIFLRGSFDKFLIEIFVSANSSKGMKCSVTKYYLFFPLNTLIKRLFNLRWIIIFEEKIKFFVHIAYFLIFLHIVNWTNIWKLEEFNLLLLTTEVLLENKNWKHDE